MSDATEWTVIRPGRPGWYFYRRRAGRRVYVLDVTVQRILRRECADGWWCGPLPVPPFVPGRRDAGGQR